MSISYITGAQATSTSAGNVSCAVGDLVLVFAYRDGSNTAPSLSTGFINVANAGANTNSARVGYKIATGTTEATGTWANATKVVALVYRTSLLGSGYSLIPGAVAAGTAASTTVNYPALTLQDASGSSWVAGFAGHRSVDTSVETAPSGMLNRQATNATTAEASGHDTNGGVTGWSSTNVSVGGTSSGWRSYVVEVKEAPPPPAGWTVLTKGGSVTNATSYNTASISPSADALVLAVITGMGVDTTDRKVPDSVGSFTLVDSEIVGTYTIGSVWRYLNASPFSGAVTIDFGSNTQDAISWVIIQKTGVDTGGTNGSSAVGTPVSAAATSVSPSPGTISFAGSTNETFVANFWGDPGSATVATQTVDTDFHEFAEQSNADSGWYTACSANVADDQQTTHTSTLSASETWASIGFEVVLASGGNYELTCQHGTYAVSGQSASLLRSKLLTASHGTYAVTGQSVGINKGLVITAQYGTYSISGQSVDLLRSKVITASHGEYSIFGQSADLLRSKLITAQSGTYSIAGQDADITYSATANNYVLTCQYGTYSVSGQSADLLRSKLITAQAGSYSVAGQDAGIYKGRVLTAQYGEYSVSGQSVELLKSKVITASSGDYSISGQSADLSIASAPGAYVLTCSHGEYQIIGSQIDLVYVRRNSGGFVPRKKERRILIVIDGNRFLIPESEVHKWVQEKTEEIVEKAFKPKSIKKLKKQKQEKIPEIITKADDSWIKELVQSANRTVAFEIEQRRIEDEEIELLLLVA